MFRLNIISHHQVKLHKHTPRECLLQGISGLISQHLQAKIYIYFKMYIMPKIYNFFAQHEITITYTQYISH